MLAVFCKLVVYNVLDLSAAAEIYQFYLKVPARPPCPPQPPPGSPSPAHCFLAQDTESG